jgi:hypothetical protein
MRFVIVLVFVVSCASRPPVVEGPPMPREELVAPRPGYIWVQGHWVRHDGRWAWRVGHYERERPSYVYVQGRWERHGNVMIWIPGSWRPRGRVTNVSGR